MIDKTADDIAKEIIENADDEAILKETMKKFTPLTDFQKQTVVEILIGALITARDSPAYPTLDK